VHGIDGNIPEDDMIMSKCVVYVLYDCYLSEVISQTDTYLYAIE